MRTRTEVALAVSVLVVVIALAGALGLREETARVADLRPSSLVSDPLGARGLADALERLGLDVSRSRRPIRQMTRALPAHGRTMLVLLDPSYPLTLRDATPILAWADRPGTGLLLAGAGADAVMRCFGYATDQRLDSVALREPASAEPGAWPRLGAVLAGILDSVVVDSSRVADASRAECRVPRGLHAEPLLFATTGRLAGIRLRRDEPAGEVLLFADAGLFRNRALRDTPAGVFVLGLFAGRYDRVIFEESRHGFGEGGSLHTAVLAWSQRSPWGWAMWQMAAVGLLALAAQSVRFGAPRRVIERRRRSPLEHVRALATALSAARGHDVAIALIVNGLRRRLGAGGREGRRDWHPWLERLGAHTRGARAREAAETLITLTRTGQPPRAVLRAANAVEDLWEDMRP